MRLIAASAVPRIIELTGAHEARARGLGHGAEHHGPFRQILLTNGPDATRRQKCLPAFRTSANAA
jgi:hypothetical protein